MESKPVVVGTDGSEHAGRAVAWAADEAALRGLPLRIVHSVDMPGRMTQDMEVVLSEAGQGVLDEARREVLARQPSVQVTTEVLSGAMSQALREQAGDAFEIVLGHRGRGGFRGLLLGSTARRVAGRVAGPVVIVRGRVEAVFGEIVAGVDPFEDEPGALEYAFEAAVARKAAIRAIHAFQIADTLLPLTPTVSTEEVASLAREELAKAVAPWREKFPQVTVTEQVIQAHPVEALVNESETADLLVLGAHGHTALGGWLVGSTTHGAFEHAHCPIVAVRPRV
ncbi:universal stress protein [Actinomadura sp. 9N407]|uniref:universal stress protein n=1 Tax=Actinomadura sp. 9N407 TaxID=3375154 RepID=UPI0037B6062D